MTQKQQSQSEAIEFLSKHLRPGMRVYTTLTHVSRSGMSRSIKCAIVDSTKEIMDISGWVGRVLDCPVDHKRGGVKVRNCGMDMGSEVVYWLGRAIWQGGFCCIGAGCNSDDHSNKPYPPFNGKMHHSDGGYSLRHNWI